MQNDVNTPTRKPRRALAVLLILVVILLLVGWFVGAYYFGPAFSFTVILIIMAGMVAYGLGTNLVNLQRLVRAAEAYEQYLADNHIDLAAEEEAFKAYINRTGQNLDAESLRAMVHWLRAKTLHPQKHLTPLAVFNLGLLILFFTGIFAFVVFMIMDLIYLAVACIGIAFVAFLILLGVHLVHKHIANNPKNVDRSLAPLRATVTACTISDETSTTTGARRRTHTTRILSTTYLVYLDVEGQAKIAYSKRPYNPGTTVYIRENRKLKNTVVIDE